MSQAAKAALRAGCALLVAVLGAAHQPALADCLQPIFFGNLDFVTYLNLDLADPSVFWRTYIFQDPSINQGSVPVTAVAIDATEFFGPLTAVAFGDWAAGLGLQGCPCSFDAGLFCLLDDDPINEVFIFGDSRGVTILVMASLGNAFNFDTTNLTGGALRTTNFRPRLVSATGDSGGLRVEAGLGRSSRQYLMSAPSPSRGRLSDRTG